MERATSNTVGATELESLLVLSVNLYGQLIATKG